VLNKNKKKEGIVVSRREERIESAVKRGYKYFEKTFN
jgi:hypothetical protein